MALLEVSGLSKSFGDVTAVDGATFAADPGEVLCLLGPSGCGKTTLLRLIAGVEDADEGTVAFDGESLDRVAPQRRGFGLMFQDLALFPHMDVFGNVAFGLRMQRSDRDAVRDRVRDLLALVDLDGYASRKVHELSGGERQRVALARSLAPAPRLLMLDEPLGALDRALRDSLQGQVRAILKEVGVTSVYVTHDRDEAFAMADRLLFMNMGRIVRSGTPEEVFQDPRDEFVARSLGFKNIVTGTVRRRGDTVEIETGLGLLSAASAAAGEAPEGSTVALLIDERGIQVRDAAHEGAAAGSSFRGTVTGRVFRGGHHEVKVRVGNVDLACIVAAGGPPAGTLPGQEVSLDIGPGAVKVLSGEQPDGRARDEG